MNYDKPPLDYNRHVDLWKSRGLVVDDYDKASHYFQSISYYRLSVYAKSFQLEKDKFNEGVSFSDVLNLYRFDRELRIIVFSAIEQIEVALRSRIIHILAHKYGSHWQDNSEIFKVSQYEKAEGKVVTKDIYSDIQNIIKDHCEQRHPEVFISHYKSTYTSPENPPSWMVIELLTIGKLSNLFSSLAVKQDKTDIARSFEINREVFEKWLHALTYARNLCAHHSRFWNRDFVIQPAIPKTSPSLPWISTVITNNRRCFYMLSVIVKTSHIEHTIPN
jgi:abortive infection bacteriophage resistance protein